ncbi:PhzF family phenazine biosynthesis protein [Saccharospirillum alexandrii]|uniref:PhzF family phenazine biosynthesis protein n=1 Tax=Saccharospirillum alexandrii TaxID=2448477 RepID=UPI000FD8179C|nr:PhzF family phenazine biosynthesis protein [Saccharospirillum alexandrii]
MSRFKFSQVNVFSTDPLLGNPLAVVHDADALTTEQMASIARWTNLSETVFLMKPTNPKADYAVRIFSPEAELPFAGHPTLGSCHAWLAAGGTPNHTEQVVQQCEVGLVTVRQDGSQLEFAAPSVMRTGPLEKEVLGQILEALSLSPAAIAHHQWVDNGPGWCAIMLHSAMDVLALDPDWTALAPLNLGVVGLHDEGGDATVEVRALIGNGGYEDPVTGSLNASLAQWLIPAGFVPSPYVAAQGTRLNRAGRVQLREANGDVWVGGHVVGVISGEITV